VLDDAMGFVKLLHVMGGLYIWEYFTSIWFEWQIIKGRRRCRWTIWLYSSCRLTALIAIILIFLGFDTTHQINCKVWIKCVFFFAYLAFVFASGLIILRIIAIWEKNLIVTAISISAWLAVIAVYIRGIARANAVWDQSANTCVILNTRHCIEPITITLAEDLLLLALMLSGLRRYGEAGMFGLWRFLYNQGLFWLALVTIAEIPPTVFIILNLNDYLNLMFQVPELIMMAVGASRIYRCLADYTCMSEFNWNEEKSWAITGGVMSEDVPTTIRFQNTRNSSQRPLSDPEMSHAETQTIEAIGSKNSVKPSSYTVTELDSPV